MCRPRTLLTALLMFCLFSAGRVYAGQTIIIQGLKEGSTLGYQLQYFFDPTGQQSASSIAARPAGQLRWQLSNTAELNFGFTRTPLWLKLRLRNHLNLSATRILEFGNPLLDTIDGFSVSHAGVRQVLIGGDTRPFMLRPIRHRKMLFAIKFQPLETRTFLFRIQTVGTLTVPLNLWTPAGFISHDQTLDLSQGIFYGAMLAMILFNLIVFIGLRERSYLYFVVYVTSLTLYLASLQGYAYQYLWPFSSWWQQHSVAVLLGLLVTFGSLFVSAFMQPQRRMANTLNITTWLGGIATILALMLPYALGLRLLLVLIVSVSLLVAWIAVTTWLHGKRSARFVTLGWGAILLGGSIMTLSKLGFLFSNEFGETSMQVGSMVEVLLLSVALIDRINQANSDRDRAQQHALLVQKQATAELEARVQERTAEVEKAMSELSQANRRLITLSAVDGLTQLNNRAYFDQKFASLWKHALRSQTTISLIFLDIDHFKRLNDKFGHQLGDEVLKIVAHTIREQIVRATDVVARYGGEEFVVLLPHTPLRDAKIVAERIRRSVARLMPKFDGRVLAMTISAGVASVTPQPHAHGSDLVRQADLALYQAKRDGRNRVVVASAQMKQQLDETSE